MSKRLFWISLLSGISLTVLVLASPPVHVESLLGVSLPASAANVQISLKRDLPGLLFGNFQGYVRFELTPQDAQVLLNTPEFQHVQFTSQPHGIMGNAISGNTSVAELALQDQPSWWTPTSGGHFLVGYRSFQPASTVRQPDADFAWYMLDLSDPAKAIAYVYVLEV